LDYMVEPQEFDPSTSLVASDVEADDAPWNAVPEVRRSEVAASQHGVRIDKLLVEVAPEFSRNHLQGLMAGGHVQLNGQPVIVASRKAQAGQTLSVELVPTEQSRAFRPEQLPLAVIFEDEHLMVVDKAAGMVVHPAAGNWSGTLLNGLLAWHPGAASLPRAGIVHRLDKDTSGVMVVGKTLQAVTALSRAIAAREVKREYMAMVHGAVRQPSFVVELPLARDPKSRVRMAVVASGKPARTDVELVASTPVCSAVRCRLHTGRTHQIRVHLASGGHPLLADTLYGGKPLLGMERQALHAARLAFTHPMSGQAMAFEAVPPSDFAQAWKTLICDA
jgi:23S rRNA pseudouridine1911/1915/1917 synthase